MDGRSIGRYVIHDEIAAGGMATVHVGCLVGPAGFSRTVAIKRLHPHLAREPEVAAMFLDEARLASRIRHPNVVATLDVVALEDELFLVLDYVHGESLARLSYARRGSPLEPRVASAIMIGVLEGLHAAHEAKDAHGEPLCLVHRDVSPQNVIVGVDGIARVVDFGVAKAVGRSRTTRDGQVKGKAAYMAPEQLLEGKVDRRTDIYAAGVVLWEILAGRPLFVADDALTTMRKVLSQKIERPSQYAPGLSEDLDRIVLRAVASDPEARFRTAREMAVAIERAAPPAPARDVGDWVISIVEGTLRRRAELVTRIEAAAAGPAPPSSSVKTNELETERVAPLPATLLVKLTSDQETSALSAVAASIPKAATWHRPLARVAMGLLGVTAIAGAALFVRRGHEPAPRAAALPLAASSALTVSSISMSGSTALQPLPPIASTPPAVSPPSSATAKPLPPPPPKRTRGAAPPPSAVNCSELFTWSDGKKIPKPECF